MLLAYRVGERGLEEIPIPPGNQVPAGAAWADLYGPTPEEDRAAETFLGLSIPTKEETAEIEFSSRFYREDRGVFMTASVLTGVEKSAPTLTPFTIVLKEDKIATVRYDDFQALRQFVARASKRGSRCGTPPAIFIGLIEAIVDRAADVLERVSQDVDRLNGEVFNRLLEGERQRKVESRRRSSALVSAIGFQGDLAAKARESLSSLERLVQYARVGLPPAYSNADNPDRLKLAARDIKSLEDHVTFLSRKINFLLDAALGAIHLEQHEVIRVLTVVAMVFFPPILIGTAYGMNFDFMPELNWPLGYPVALALILGSALLPYAYFRRRGWL